MSEVSSSGMSIDMRIAVTGCNGSVGHRVVACALHHGHDVVGIDINDPPASENASRSKFSYIKADRRVYQTTLQALEGCTAVIHLAAYPNPNDYVATTHNSNVVISWNVLRSAAELGITRIAQASTVNVLAGVYSIGPKFDYFPIDEDHPCRPDEPYGLSKQIAELQADTIIRRFPTLRIASLRLHWSIPSRAKLVERRNKDITRAKNDLWGYVQEDSAAEAFLLAATGENGKWSGHERFLIAAPDASYDGDVATDLWKKYWGDVPIKDGKDANELKGFYDCSKAERLLDWKHRNPVE